MNTKNHHSHPIKSIIFSILGLMAVLAGVVFIWIATMKIPDFSSFDQNNIAKSTKIYDRTGEILLYDIHEDYKRTVIPFDAMGVNIKNATVAIEDSEFYQHSGVRIKSIFRAVFETIFKGHTQGGSTITQQVIKNSLLTKEKTIPRKIKEWILSIKLEESMGKEDILAIYLNGNPYGGNIYGIEEAAQTFFKKEPKDLSIAEAAYMAAIPQLPSFYSPYGKNLDKLEVRKNTVLAREKELGFITDEEYTAAKAEVVTFEPKETVGLKAPHFVFYIKDYLENKYGAEKMAQGGLKVTTTLDYDIEQKAEEVAKKNALKNEKDFNASNTAVVVLDPKTGQILSMVGSRDYFDKDIDGQFNVATASRQPGSSFKPFIYATAFEKGFTPETVLFDVPTEFNPSCSPYKSSGKSSKCYFPDDYDNKYRGPMELRDALAQSINIPAVKLLYLVGIKDALKVAKDMGIRTLTDPERYGLTLVLGGGEVSPLDMASAYGVFANSGVREEPTGILKVEDSTGVTLEQYQEQSHEVLPKNIALTVSDILSDNNARIPTFGANSTLNVSPNVAVKTGTTNLNKDAWMIGYSNSAVVAVWSGNNENTSMKKGSTVSGPTFNEIMKYTLTKYPNTSFESPQPEDNYDSLKPVLRGKWLGGESFIIDSISGKLATANTPKETQVEKVVTNVHDILYWVNKNDILGPSPADPTSDSQFNHWELGVQNWWRDNASQYPGVTLAEKPTTYDDVHTEASKPIITILSPNQTTVYQKNDSVFISIQTTGMYGLKKADFFLNGSYLGSSSTPPFTFSFTPNEVDDLGATNEIKVVGYDQYYNNNSTTIPFQVAQ